MIDKDSKSIIDFPTFDLKVKKYLTDQIFDLDLKSLFSEKSFEEFFNVHNSLSDNDFDSARAFKSEEIVQSYFTKANIWIDVNTASLLLPLLIKQFGYDELRSINVIFIEDKIIDIEDVHSSNFSIIDVGELGSEVLSSRYNIPVSILNSKFNDKYSFSAIIAGVKSMDLRKDESRITFGEQSNNMVFNFVINVNESLIDEEFLSEDTSIVNCMEFCLDSTKMITEVMSKSVFHDPYTFNEFFTYFVLNIQNFIKKIKTFRDFRIHDLPDAIFLRGKKGNKVYDVEYINEMIFNFTKSLELIQGRDTRKKRFKTLELSICSHKTSCEKNFQKNSENFILFLSKLGIEL